MSTENHLTLALVEVVLLVVIPLLSYPFGSEWQGIACISVVVGLGIGIGWWQSGGEERRAARARRAFERSIRK
jgi:hypothetical protein